MNRRGDFFLAGEFWMLLVRLFFLILVAFSIFAVVSFGVNKRFDIGDVEEEVIFNAIYMNSCINYEDVRIYPGVIDLKKFDKSLGECFKGKNFGVRVSLRYEEKEIENFVDKKFFEIENRFCSFKQYRCSDFTVPVIVKENDLFKYGRLKMEIVLKNA